MDIKSEDSTFISQETNSRPKYVQNLLSNLENFKKNCDKVYYTDLIQIIENFEFLIGLFRYGGYGANSKTIEDSIKSDDFINIDFINSLETCFKNLLNNEYKIIYLFINNQKNSMTNILTKFDSPAKFKREVENLNIHLSMDKYQIKEDENIFDIEHNFKDQNIENVWKSYLEGYSENSNNKSKLNNIISDQDRLLNQQQIKVIDNFCYLFKVFYSKFINIVANQSISSYPSLNDRNDIYQITKYLTEIYNLKEESSINTNDRLNKIDIAFKIRLLDILDEPSSSTSRKDDGAFNYEDEEDIDDEIYIPNRPKKNPISNQKNKHTNIFNFEKIKRNLIYFINIISKDNKYFNNDEIKSISDAISKYLSLQNNNLFIIQNSRINEFIKSSNFEDISLDNIKFQPISSKFYELKSLKNELLIKEYHFKKNLFDNSGNFLSPNSRQNIFRGKERYDPPYNWIGIGLNVIGKYEDDKWLNDISDKSEWAIAYRGIGTNISSNDVKIYLRYFIEKGLNIAKSSSKSKSNDKRRWKKVGEGIYMTPYIKIAEKYTQNITFNNKKYKVLLMAKVKIDKIREPKGTNFWVLDDEDIRIYRILFKSIE